MEYNLKIKEIKSCEPYVSSSTGISNPLELLNLHLLSALKMALGAFLFTVQAAGAAGQVAHLPYLRILGEWSKAKIGHSRTEKSGKIGRAHV